MRDFDIKTKVKADCIMMASNDEEDLLDRVYLYLTEKRGMQMAHLKTEKG